MRGVDRQVVVLLCILVVSAVIRLPRITMPLFEGAPVKQVEVAMVARNFYEHGYRFHLPQWDIFGDAPGIVVQEFPICAFSVAIIYGLLGGVYEVVGRLLSVGCFLVAIAFLYRLVGRYYGNRTAAAAALVMGILPLGIIYSRAFQSESLTLMFGVMSLYYFDRWIDREGWRDYLMALLSISLCLLTKIYNYYYVLPLLYLAWWRFGRRALRDLRFWAFFGVLITAVGLWYGYAYVTNQSSVPYLTSYWNYFNRANLVSTEFYKRVFDLVTGVVLTPLGFTLFVLGSLLSVKMSREWVFHIWLGGGLLFLFTLSSAIDTHDYYYFSLLPVASVFISRSVTLIYEGIGQRRWAPLMVASAIVVIIATIGRYLPRAYAAPADSRSILAAAREVKRQSRPGDLVITSSWAAGVLQYYSHRRGWSMYLDSRGSYWTRMMEERMPSFYKDLHDPIALVENHRRKGARLFVTTEMAKLESEGNFVAHMKKHYRLTVKTDGYVIFDLR